MDKDRIRYLLHQYITDSCTPAEEEEFNVLLGEEEQIKNLLDEFWADLGEKELNDINTEKAWNLMEGILVLPRKGSHRKNGWWLRAVASIVLVTVLGALFFYKGNRQAQDTAAYPAPEKAGNMADVMPASGEAVLTIANRAPMRLSAEKGGIMIKGNQITYTDGTSVLKNSDWKDIVTVKLETPVGGEYQLTLEDGTRVRLNASSVLKYPIHFQKKDTREVELEGEAFFEVAQAKSWPFMVKSPSQKVEVLGTAFNIAAYRDDASFKTTLLEGSVRVSKTSPVADDILPMVLKPGQQAVVRKDAGQITRNSVDLNEIIAWKDGLFVFNDESIKSMMKRLARWYDMEVVYEGNVDHIRFQGNYSRHKSLKNLLKSIELTGTVKFKIENNGTSSTKKVIVMGRT